MLKKNLWKVAILLALAVQLAVGVAVSGAVAPEEPLCLRNASNGCDNNGCEATGGVCGRAFAAPKDSSVVAASPCWCLY